MSRFATVEPANHNDDFAAQLVCLRPDLYARALFLAQDRFQADDLVQEVIERALVARARFQRGTHLRAWLGQILRNLFIDSRRRVLTHARLDQEAELERPSVVPPGSPLELLSGDDVTNALACLDATQREAFMLACLDGLTYQEIAARVGVPVSTVGTRLLRAKRKLRRHLDRVYEDRLACKGLA